MRPIVNVVLPSSGNFAIFKEDADRMVKDSVLFRCDDCDGYHVVSTFNRKALEHAIYALIDSHAGVLHANAAPVPVEDPKAKAVAALNGVLDDIAKRVVVFNDECQAAIKKAANDAMASGVSSISVFDVLERAKGRVEANPAQAADDENLVVFLARLLNKHG